MAKIDGASEIKLWKVLTKNNVGNRFVNSGYCVEKSVAVVVMWHIL